MLPEDRIVEFDGTHNFRDIGGLLTKNGCVMKRGMLYRSGSLHQLSKKDIKKIENLQIKSIIDLRMPNERRRKCGMVHSHPNIRIESIPIYPLPLREDPSTIKRLIGFISGKYKELNFEMLMSACYRRIALENLAEIKRIFIFLSDQGHVPAIIHCQGGKDRTGWLSVLFQSIAEVPLKVIYEDYLLSNEFMLQNIEKQKRMIRWFTFFQYDLERVMPAIEARKEYLSRTIETVLNTFGTIEGYLEKACGLSRATVDQFKKLLCPYLEIGP